MAALDWSIGRVHTGPVAHASRLLTMAACLSAVSGVLTAQSVETPSDTAARPGAVSPDFTLLTLAGDSVAGPEHERSDRMQQTHARGHEHRLGRVALALGVLVAFLPKQSFGQG